MGVTPPENTAYRGYDPHGTSRPDAPTPPGASENRPGADFAQSNLARSNFEAAGGTRAVSFAPPMGVKPPEFITNRGYDPHGRSKLGTPTPPGASENRPGADSARRGTSARRGPRSAVSRRTPVETGAHGADTRERAMETAVRGARAAVGPHRALRRR